MPFPKLTIETSDGTRDVCVIDGQPFYCSTGNNSDMSGVWLPFEGFEKPLPGLIPFFVKPDATNYHDNIIDNFPKNTATELQRWANTKSSSHDQESEGNDDSAQYWGRFKNIKCLYTSCLLTPKEVGISPEIRLAVSRDIQIPGNNIIPNEEFELEKESRCTIKLNKDIVPDDVDNLNEILSHMGHQPADEHIGAVPLNYIRMSQKGIQHPLPLSQQPFPEEKILTIEQQINRRYVEPVAKPHITPMSITPTSTQSSSQAWYDCSQCFGKKEDKGQSAESSSKDDPTTHNPMQRDL